MLVRPGTDWSHGEPTCPAAKAIHAIDDIAGYQVLLQITCKRWGCIYCGPLRVKRLAAQNVAAEPNRLVTLTVDPKRWATPLEAWNGTCKAVSRLAQKLRKKRGEIEYMRVLETTKAGWPHYHLVMRSAFIPWTDIRDEWQSLTGARIVDVRRIKDAMDISRYVVKYLAKQNYIPWTNRRIAFTKNYVPKTFHQDTRRTLSSKTFIKRHPLAYADECLVGYLIERIAPNAWRVDDPHEFKNLRRFEESDL